MNTQNEIISFLKANSAFLMQHYHLTKIGLFGSFARNEQNEHSDVDILIELDDNVKNIHDVKNSLREFLTTAFNRSVDLAREKYLKPYVKNQILNDVMYV